jgi:hypothetical protein
MKWPKAICASILVDGFYATLPRLSPRPVNRGFRPNLLTPDWGLPAEPFGTGSQNSWTVGRQASRESVIDN